MKKKTKKKRKLTNIKNDIWEICKKVIRERDNNKCQRCGKHVEGMQSHTSHVIPKSHGNALRFDFLNLKVLCYPCHNWWHSSPCEASRWYAQKFPARYKYLMDPKNQQKTLKRSDLENMLEEYKKLLPKNKSLVLPEE